MIIVVLDGHTLNPGDLSWHELETLGDCTIHDRTPPAAVTERAADAEIVLTNKTVLPRPVIASLPRMRYIGLLATGYDVVDVEAARERGIPVTNVPTYATESVAQMVFAHLLNLTQRMGDHTAGVHAGRWSASIDYCYWDYPLIELAGLTMGIVGFGRIGRATASLAQAFGMHVLAFDAVMPELVPTGVEAVDLERLLRRSDVVSLHCPLTPQSEGMINAQALELMKETAFLINTSRGSLVDEPALADALNAGRLAGAGLDVLTTEPPISGNPLLAARNCFVTPHIAWATKAARKRLLDTAVGNVRAFLDGAPRNVVNPA